MSIDSFGLTNAAQIINNTIINTTEIVNGRPYDDATLKGIIISKSDSYGFVKKLDTDTKILNEENKINNIIIPFSSKYLANIELLKTYPLIISVRTKDENGNLISISNDEWIELSVNDVMYKPQRTSSDSEYWSETVDVLLNQELKIVAYINFNKYFLGQEYVKTEVTYTVPETITDILLPTLFVDVINKMVTTGSEF